MCTGAEIVGAGGGGGVRSRAARAPELIRRSIFLLLGAVVVVRSARAAVRPAAAADRAQARVRARASPGQRVPGRAQAHLRASSPEALQDRVHQGADPADPDRAHHPGAASERGEDPRLCVGEEARGAARYRDPDPGADAARQAGGLLHQIQDPGKIFIFAVLNN